MGRAPAPHKDHTDAGNASATALFVRPDHHKQERRGGPGMAQGIALGAPEALPCGGSLALEHGSPLTNDQVARLGLHSGGAHGRKHEEVKVRGAPARFIVSLDDMAQGAGGVLGGNQVEINGERIGLPGRRGRKGVGDAGITKHDAIIKRIEDFVSLVDTISMNKGEVLN